MVGGERLGAATWGRDTRRHMRAPFDVVWDLLVTEDAAVPADAIFCFGSRHWRVPERAAALFHQGLAPCVLVTGAAELSEAETEARHVGIARRAKH